MRGRSIITPALLAITCLVLAPAAWAQGPQVQPEEPSASGEPPTPPTGVGRVSQIQGAVSTQRGDSGDWSAATVNTPIVPGDRISTGDRSRAEVQLDYANILRLDENAVVRVTDLSNGRIQIEVAQGVVSFSRFPASAAEVEIDTPNLAIHPGKDGAYRIQVNSDGETLVSVRRGQAEVGTAEGSTTLASGQLITVRGDAGSAQYRISNAFSGDSFDLWNDERDQYIQRAQASQSQYVNTYYTGSADLNSSGTWQQNPDYGAVWTPSNVPADWAPYRDGSWLWEPDWGWTWASYEPWGWAPYHYGRWFLWGSRWAWWPGPVTPFYRPAWAPAYVSFFGFGGGGFGFGSFGWLPCGPADFFFPWWGIGRAFSFAAFNSFSFFFHSGHGHGWAPLGATVHGRPGFSNVGGLTTNPRLRAGITSVAANRFGGRVVPERRTFGADEIRGAQFARGGLPVAPTRASLSASGRPATPGTVPSRSLGAQHFYSRNQPAAAPHSFASESAQFRQQMNRAFGSDAGSFDRGPAARVTGPGSQPQRFAAAPNSSQQGFSRGSTPPARGGWNSFQSGGALPSTSGAGVGHGVTQPRALGAENNTGWQRFNGRQVQPGQPNAGMQGRQQLDLHHSIVQRPTSPGAYGQYSGGYHPSPQHSYAAPPQQPAMRAPQVPQGYSAAPHYGAASPQSAPHYSAPPAPRTNQGGGGYRGGGGNRGGGGGSHGGGSPRPSHFSSGHSSGHAGGSHHSGRR